jgi:hypothetical protein
MSLGPNQRIAQARLQTQPVDARGAGRRRRELVGQFDRLAEVGGGLLERRRRKAWSPAFPHHSIAGSSSAAWVR